MKTPLTILGISVASFLLAACLLGALLTRPISFFAGPIIALFGWPYFPVVLLLHICAWFALPRLGYWRGFPWAGALFAATLFAVIGVKEDGAKLHFALAYFIAAFISGYLSCRLLARYRFNR
jgi:hypothetical protein